MQGVTGISQKVYLALFNVPQLDSAWYLIEFLIKCKLLLGVSFLLHQYMAVLELLLLKNKYSNIRVKKADRNKTSCSKTMKPLKHSLSTAVIQRSFLNKL